jgi:hypothetical protein
MLFGDPQRVIADHQIPCDERVPRLVRRSGSQAESLERAPPTLPAIVQVTDRLAILLHEHVLMIDPCPEPLPAFAQGELALQYRDGARAERDNAFLAGLRYGPCHAPLRAPS